MKKYFLLLFLSAVYSGLVASDTSRTVTLRIIITPGFRHDSATLRYSEYALTTITQTNFSIHNETRAIENAVFKLTIPQGQKSVYIFLRLKNGKSPLLNGCPAEPGDDVTLTINDTLVTATGTGSAKYICSWQVYRALRYWKAPADIADVPIPTGMSREFSYPAQMARGCRYQDGRRTAALQVLETSRPRLSKWAYHLMQADIWGDTEKEKLSAMLFFHANFPRVFDNIAKDSLQRGILSAYLAGSKWYPGPDTSAATASVKYTMFLYDLSSNSRLLFGQESMDWILKNFCCEQRDKLLASYVILRYKSLPVSVLSEAAQQIQTPLLRDTVQKLADNLQKGAPFFPFELSSTDGRVFRPADFSGKTVFMKMWFTGCPGCLALQKEMPRITEAFKGDSSIVFVSVSVDEDKDTWLKSITNEKYTSRHYLNLYTNGKGTSDPFIQNYRVAGYPTVFIMDKQNRFYSTLLPSSYTDQGIQSYVQFLKRAAK